MWQSALGLGLSLVSLGITVACLVVDDWVRFHDSTGYIPGEGVSGLWHVCFQGICLPVAPVWNVYVDAPRGLIIAGIVVFAIYCLAGLAYMFRRGNYWQYLYRPLGIAVCVKGLFSATAGSVCLMHLNDMTGLIALLFHFEKVEIQPGWCSLLAIVVGIIEMIAGLVMFHLAHKMEPEESSSSQVANVNTLIAHVQAQHTQPSQQPPAYGEYNQSPPNYDQAYGQPPTYEQASKPEDNTPPPPIYEQHRQALYGGRQGNANLVQPREEVPATLQWQPRPNPV